MQTESAVCLLEHGQAQLFMHARPTLVTRRRDQLPSPLLCLSSKFHKWSIFCLFWHLSVKLVSRPSEIVEEVWGRLATSGLYVLINLNDWFVGSVIFCLMSGQTPPTSGVMYLV